MSQGEKKFLYLAVFLCFSTGLCMFVLKNFFEVIGEFGYQEHWLLDDVKMFHYIFTPFLVVSFGLLWQGHISKGVKNKKRAKRNSGLFILTIMILLVFTGQAMLWLMNTDVRNGVGWIHAAAGLLITIGILRHSLKK